MSEHRHFPRSKRAYVVGSRPEARAFKLERRGSQILETRLATRYLGAEAPATVIPLVRRAAA